MPQPEAPAEGTEWTIAEVARAAGTTSRTLRHYGELGLVAPSRIGTNGYRYYDRHAIVRLQRVLLLRELGLGLPVIGEVLDRERDERRALRDHVRWLESERARLDRQLTAVRGTLIAIEQGEEPDMNEMLDGFDYTKYQDEVAQRWGAETAERSADWWSGQSADDKAAFQQRVERLNADWRALAEAGADPRGGEAQAVAARHVDWLTSVPGTPATDGDDEATRDYVRALADLYVADERFAANYGDAGGAAFVRDALLARLGDGDVS